MRRRYRVVERRVGFADNRFDRDGCGTDDELFDDTCPITSRFDTNGFGFDDDRRGITDAEAAFPARLALDDEGRSDSRPSRRTRILS